MKLIQFSTSTRPDKRYVATFANPSRTIHFGTKKKNTFVDHGNTAIRANHLMRRPDFVVVNEEALDLAVLWGETMSVEGNLAKFLEYLNIIDERLV
jgi:hypothetical protein